MLQLVHHRPVLVSGQLRAPRIESRARLRDLARELVPPLLSRGALGLEILRQRNEVVLATV